MTGQHQADSQADPQGDPQADPQGDPQADPQGDPQVDPQGDPGAGDPQAGDPAPGVPLLVRLTGRRVVCVGAGPVVTTKALPLLDAGADLLVIAPQAEPALREAAAAGRLCWQARSYRTGDLAGALLAVAGTADPAVNDRVAADAAAAGVLCVRVDRVHDGPPGSAAFMGVVRRGRLTLAVSTDGQAPALTRRLRVDLEQAYGPEYGALVELLGRLRRSPAVRERLDRLSDRERRARWRAVLDADILTLLRAGLPDAATEVAAACLCSSSD
jgi:precorrin-2 dehydrogenase/sirohydrochlorin ferrochelatase